MRRLLNVHRAIWVGVALLLQVLILVWVISRFNVYFVYFYGATTLLSVLVVLAVVNGHDNPGYKMAWIILILLFPIFGGLFYLMFGGNKLAKRARRKLAVVSKRMAESFALQSSLSREIELHDPTAVNQSRYISDYAYGPPFSQTASEYLTHGKVMVERLKDELNKAERFIFLEYFIIGEGLVWNSILEILARKARQGLDVRIIYDDLGCIMRLPYGYDRTLNEMGIKCCVFNPLLPFLSFHVNTRDHRKMTIIDGHTGFVGGINLADEYVRDPYWKDTAVIIKGEAVWSLTVMFLSMWEFLHGVHEDYEQYRADHSSKMTGTGDGIVQPFSDSPLDHEFVGKTVYLNLINKARRYVYITSPYLILDNEIATALTSTAKMGIEVRVITPHIPDKATVHAVTQSNYEALIASGVRIFEYSPGFIHAKSIVVDDSYAVVGTINFDYRSLYLSFECGLWMYQTTSVHQVRNDFLATLDTCQEVSLQACQQVSWIVRLGRAVLRVFAPLM